jgi:hypothetical protein
MKISDLKEFVDRTVTLRMTDGEVLRVRVLFRSEEYNDIIVDVLETTRPERYDPSSAYSFNAADILSVEGINDPAIPGPAIDPAP